MKKNLSGVSNLKFRTSLASSQADRIEGLADILLIVGILASVVLFFYGFFNLPSESDVILGRGTKVFGVSMMLTAGATSVGTIVLCFSLAGFSGLLNLEVAKAEETKKPD